MFNQKNSQVFRFLGVRLRTAAHVQTGAKSEEKWFYWVFQMGFLSHRFGINNQA